MGIQYVTVIVNTSGLYQPLASAQGIVGIIGPAPSAGTPAVPQHGSPGWLAAHGHPPAVCVYGCHPPDVSWTCPLVHECDDAADPYYLCSCHWALL